VAATRAAALEPGWEDGLRELLRLFELLVAVEGAEKVDDGFDLVVRELFVGEEGRAVRVCETAARHETHGFFERLFRAVVEVRGALRDVAEGRDLEGSLVH